MSCVAGAGTCCSIASQKAVRSHGIIAELLQSFLASKALHGCFACAVAPCRASALGDRKFERAAHTASSMLAGFNSEQLQARQYAAIPLSLSNGTSPPTAREHTDKHGRNVEVRRGYCQCVRSFRPRFQEASSEPAGKWLQEAPSCDAPLPAAAAARSASRITTAATAAGKDENCSRLRNWWPGRKAGVCAEGGSRLDCLPNVDVACFVLPTCSYQKNIKFRTNSEP